MTSTEQITRDREGWLRDAADEFRRWILQVSADGTNGGQNEAGLKRLATIRRTAAKLGIEVTEK